MPPRERGRVIAVMPAYNAEARWKKPWPTSRQGLCDVVLGNRIRTRREALACGMPVWKYLANRALTLIENFVLGQNLGEFHSGFRAYSRRVLETIPYHRNSDDFVFDQEFLIQAVQFGCRLGDVPVPVKYVPEASSITFRRSLRYGVQTLLTLARWVVHRAGLRRDPLFTQGG